MTSVYGVFEDGALITGVFTDLGAAEDRKDELRKDPDLGDLEALELCPDHYHAHPYGHCPEPDDTALLLRLRNALEKL